LGKANPYGVYDLAADSGWVSMGTDHDTAAFAVETIRRWWQQVGTGDYPNASRLLITADGGGSNGYRTRLWKTELAALAATTGLSTTCCHLPPGTSKWNKIEHRLFSHISMNWRGRPLTSHDVIVQTIAATTTRTGLTVHAELDTGTYPTGIKIPDNQMQQLHDTGTLRRHDWHPEWNYTLNPPPPERVIHRQALGSVRTLERQAACRCAQIDAVIFGQAGWTPGDGSSLQRTSCWAHGAPVPPGQSSTAAESDWRALMAAALPGSRAILPGRMLKRTSENRGAR